MPSKMSFLNKLKKELKSSPVFFSLLFILLLLAFFVRIYRVEEILGFYFDQGRDANVIWDLLHKGEVFLIGPTTGIAGIFRGPFYYYLIAPLYWLGGGDPVYPAVFLGMTTVLALGVLYYLGVKMGNRMGGLLAVLFGSFSFYVVLASRWLSNPTPMLLLSVLLMLAMVWVMEGKKWAWVLIAFLAGSSLFHFGSSGELFYFPAIALFGLWQWSNRPTVKILLMSGLAFFVTVAPLILFDFIHGHILSSNIREFGGGSFGLPSQSLLESRVELYIDVFTNKIFHDRKPIQILFLVIATICGLVFSKRMFKNNYARIPFLLLISPVVGLLFFHGNDGVVYDYYLTGYYLMFILLLALVLGTVWQYSLGKIFVVYFMALFLIQNGNTLQWYLTYKGDGPETISFIGQKQALDWIYMDANGKDFSTDVYVPPVIPHAYDYLFRWYGEQEKGYAPSAEQIDPLYTLYEVDPPHPERLQVWLDRQAGIGRVEKEARFGGIVVQRRTRL
jgi:4-amino-4-deoxy-L-arabinose transferase-like glycosyltransferase